MIGDFCMHGPDHADVVDMLSGVVEELTDFDSRLTVAGKLERRRQGGPGFAFGW